MTTELFVDLMSQPCRALAMFVKMSQVPCEMKPVALRKGEHKGKEFLKINPLGKVPVLKDGDFILTESVAILRYLASKFGENKLYPSNIQTRAKVDEYLAWQHMNTRYKASMVFAGEFMFPGKVNVPKAVSDMNQMLDELQFMFLKDNRFLTGDRLTIADIFALCELMQPTISGRDIFEGRPKLIAWKERVEKATNPYFDEAHSIFYRVKKHFAKPKL